MNSIKKQLMVIVSLVVLISVGTLGAINLYFLNDIKNMTVQRTESKLFENYDLKIKNLVETAEGILEKNNQLYESGELSLKEAQTRAKESIRNLRYGKDDIGYFWIDSEEYVNILFPGSPESEGKSRKNLQDTNDKYIIRELVDGAVENGDTFLDYYFPKPGEEESSLKRGYTRHFKPWGWVIGTGNYVDDIEAVIDEFNTSITNKINNVTNLSIIAIIALIFLSLIVIFIYTTKLSNSIKTVRNSINKIANNDLTGKDLEVTEKHEIGDLKKYYNKMKNNLKELISDIRQESENLAASSEELTATSEQVSIASNEVAQTIQEIANGATDQAEETTEGAKDINVLGNIITSEIELVEKLNKSAKTVDELKEEGFVVLKDLEEKTTQNNEATNEVQDIIIKTNENADKIEKASDMIKNIAKQTNLLALNASIEAARAGEAGKGFAVVADEIRKLAEETNQFASEISDTIQNLNEMTEKGVVTMEKANEIVKKQMTSLDNTHNKFEGISDSIENVDNVVEKLNESTDNMISKKDQIINIIENLSAISEENAAGTQQASASVEEQTASMSQISEASEELAKLAEDMQSNISKFKI
ncbi:MAG: methyl-accepting chemotaxis protein [Bacillota bacterium]